MEKVRERLMRAVAALERAQIPYAVAGGNAVAAWVSRVDEAAVRNTPDVDIVLRRGDLPAAMTALAAVGFIYRQIPDVDLFLDGPQGKPRDAVHVWFAGENVRPDYAQPSPDVDQVEAGPSFRLLALEPLVRMKLTSFRCQDKMHLLDMIDVGLIDASWPARLPPPLAERLQQLLDNPDG